MTQRSVYENEDLQKLCVESDHAYHEFCENPTDETWIVYRDTKTAEQDFKRELEITEATR